MHDDDDEARSEVGGRFHHCLGSGLLEARHIAPKKIDNEEEEAAVFVFSLNQPTNHVFSSDVDPLLSDGNGICSFINDKNNSLQGAQVGSSDRNARGLH